MQTSTDNPSTRVSGTPIDELITAERTASRGQRFLNSDVLQRMAESCCKQGLLTLDPTEVH